MEQDLERFDTSAFVWLAVQNSFGFADTGVGGSLGDAGGRGSVLADELSLCKLIVLRCSMSRAKFRCERDYVAYLLTCGIGVAQEDREAVVDGSAIVGSHWVLSEREL